MRVLIYVFAQVEVLDFTGPFEVFSTATRLAQRRDPRGQPPFEVRTVAATADPVVARGGLTVLPSDTIDRAAQADVLIIPGGVVSEECNNIPAILWIRTQANGAQLVMSVCTGVFLLARAGLLDGRTATTHWEDIAELRESYPAVRVREEVRFVDDGKFSSSAGIAAGLDLSFHLVARLCGVGLAMGVARQMEYPWLPAERHDYRT